MSENTGSQTISGTVDSVIYRNEENGYTVLELESEDEYIIAVGELGDIQAGEEVTLVGDYTTHSKYGLQFNAIAVDRNLPSNASAIKKYLASGIIKGIGPATAKKIVDKFGDDTLIILEKTPERLTEVSGISKQMCDRIKDDFKALLGIRTVMLELGKYGIAPVCCVNAWKAWGKDTLDVVYKNPYILCFEPVNMSFEEVDLFATQINSATSPDFRYKAGISYILEINSQSGHTCLPKDRLKTKAVEQFNMTDEDFDRIIDEETEDENLVEYVKKDRSFIYLANYFKAERYVAERLALIKRCFPEYNDNYERDIKKAEKGSGIFYDDIQKKSIITALSNGVMVLTGGPGTGKTTTLNAIISILKERNNKVLICAPTGRAAKRIAELTGYEAKTIHRMLEVEYSNERSIKFAKNEDNLLKCNTLIIDEMSMVDILLFEAVLRAMPLSSRIILVGDFNQLPSVGPGNVLKDIIDTALLPTIELKEIFRQAENSAIVYNAHRIIKGKEPDFETKDSDFFFLKRLNEAGVQKTVEDLYDIRLPKAYGYSPLVNIQVLCPSRKGRLGTISLNNALQKRINPVSPDKNELRYKDVIFRERDKVMQIKNDYNLIWKKGPEQGTGVFNGDIGYIVKIDEMARTVDVKYDDRIVSYVYDQLGELELAYAITVHKSQGSEFDAVILPLFSGYEKLFYRSLLYTAVTRAKNQLIIVGSEEAIGYMVNHDRRTLRYSCLKSLLERYISNADN